MPEITGRPSTRLEPATTWTVVTDSPLKGSSFAREAGTILAWDEGNQLYLLERPRRVAVVLTGAELASSPAAISDEGSLIALLVEADGFRASAHLSADFDVQLRTSRAVGGVVRDDRPARAISGGRDTARRASLDQPLRPAAGRLETMEPLSHLCFVPGRPIMVGAAAFGMLVGIELEPNRSQGRLDPEIIWQDRLMSNVGRLALDGEGGMILASCFTLGIQRFDLAGPKRGLLSPGRHGFTRGTRLPGPDDRGGDPRGELAVMNSAGNVRWRTRLPRPVIALEIDPLGRYLIYGHATGEIVRLTSSAVNAGKAAATSERRAVAALTRHQRCGPRPARSGYRTGWFMRSKPTSRRRRP